jgi:Flp pilus assembly protein TadG
MRPTTSPAGFPANPSAAAINASRRGTAAVEFAICVPLLLLFALASADFGRASYYHQVVCNAARTGAESGATHKFTSYTRPAWENAVHEAVLAEMNNIPHFDVDQMTYQLTTTVDADGLARVRLGVSYPFRTAVAWPGLPSSVTLSKAVEYREFR